MADIKEITFENLRFNPYDVIVDDLEPGLILKFKAELQKEKHQDLVILKSQTKSRNGYFDVYIDNSQPIKMRLGRPTYSFHENKVKYISYISQQRI